MNESFTHQPRKRFGQNFLQDRNSIAKIISAINPKATDTFVEIGPGLGAITDPLQQRCATLHLIEIDRDLSSALQEKYRLQTHIHVHQADALSFNFSTIAPTFRVVGNLPYNISTPLLLALLNYYSQIQDAYFMLQKEVVTRICAAPGNKNYGRLSIFLQYYFNTEHLFDVPPNAFFPIPKVNSAIIRLQKTTPKILAENLPAFQNLCKIAFAQRRKTLRNNLKSIYSKELIEHLELSYDLSRRPETMHVDEYIHLSNAIEKFHYDR